MDKKIQGYEVCPYCGTETEFEVGKKEWYAECSYCGRPILLCDKCFTMLGGKNRDCGKCKRGKKLSRLMKAWVSSKIGQIVYWRDPDDDECSGYFKVKNIVDDCYVLVPITLNEVGLVEEGEMVDAPDYEVDLLDEETQLKYLIGLFGGVWK